MAKTNLADKKINNLIRKTIIETISQILKDPDYNSELQAWVKKRLKKNYKNLAPLEEIGKKYL